jgi:hypothetical protein
MLFLYFCLNKIASSLLTDKGNNRVVSTIRYIVFHLNVFNFRCFQYVVKLLLAEMKSNLKITIKRINDQLTFSISFEFFDNF